MKALLILSLLIFTSTSYAQCRYYTVYENGTYRSVQVCGKSKQNNNSLNDSIANSGSENYEKMRRGWLPNKDERNNRRLKELEIQLLEQQLNNN